MPPRNGSSITAVDGGKSVDTSLGYGTAEGVLMGTRSGSLDPSVMLYLMEKHGDVKTVSDIVHKKSGLQGRPVYQATSAMSRKLPRRATNVPDLRRKCLSTMLRSISVPYAAAMGGIDVLVFTAGIGENGISFREDVCRGLEFMGIKIDPEKNKVRGKEPSSARRIQGSW